MNPIETMSAEEFKVLQKRMGINNLQLARLLNYGAVMISRYRNGKSSIPGPVAFWMRNNVEVLEEADAE